jgi:predicted amidophosphoribosyltransferase
MGGETKRCLVCAKEKTFEGSICEECKAMIRGEASEKGKKIRKEAEKEIRREGIPPKK